MYLLVPSSATACAAVVQLEVSNCPFCWRVNPVEAEGQEMTAVLVGLRRIFSDGAPGVCTATRLQKPAVMEYEPPDIVMAASDWPIVPLSE